METEDERSDKHTHGAHCCPVLWPVRIYMYNEHPIKNGHLCFFVIFASFQLYKNGFVLIIVGPVDFYIERVETGDGTGVDLCTFIISKLTGYFRQSLAISGDHWLAIGINDNSKVSTVELL